MAQSEVGQGCVASTGPLIEISGKQVRTAVRESQSDASTGPLIEISGKLSGQAVVGEVERASTGPLIEISGKEFLLVAGPSGCGLQRGR